MLQFSTSRDRRHNAARRQSALKLPTRVLTGQQVAQIGTRRGGTAHDLQRQRRRLESQRRAAIFLGDHQAAQAGVHQGAPGGCIEVRRGLEEGAPSLRRAGALDGARQSGLQGLLLRV